MTMRKPPANRPPPALREARRGLPRWLGTLLALLGAGGAGAVAPPPDGPATTPGDGPVVLRLDAIRTRLLAGDAAAGPAGSAAPPAAEGDTGQWFNWPNWANWSKWANWNNWNNWGKL